MRFTLEIAMAIVVGLLLEGAARSGQQTQPPMEMAASDLGLVTYEQPARATIEAASLSTGEGTESPFPAPRIERPL